MTLHKGEEMQARIVLGLLILNSLLLAKSDDFGSVVGSFARGSSHSHGGLSVFDSQKPTFVPTDGPDTTLRYDGPDTSDGIGLVNGGTFVGAVRFTNSFASSVTVKAILFFHLEPSADESILVYHAGTDTAPGRSWASLPYLGANTSWVPCTTGASIEIQTDSSFWVGVRITNLAGHYPLGIDAGPSDSGHREFVALGSGDSTADWLPLMSLGYDVNWHIQAVVEPLVHVAHDVGVTQILSPHGRINLGDRATPRVLAHNYGSSSETFDITFTVSDGYVQTIARTVAPGADSTFSFPDWTASQIGKNTTRCTLALSTDTNPANNAFADSVIVDCIDVGATAIVSPPEFVDSGSDVVPVGRVHNSGTVASVNFYVRMRIATSPPYDNAQLVSYLAPGADAVVPFQNWHVNSPLGTYAASCSTELSTDINRANDRKTGQVRVRTPVQHDVGCVAIIVPPDTVEPGNTYFPACSLHNWGDSSAAYQVRLRIGAYNNVRQITSHAPHTSVYVTFPDWTAPLAGQVVVSCSTELANDQDRSNDKKADSVIVANHDVGCSVIVAPAGSIDSGAVVTPACSLYNYGTVAESGYTVRMKIGSISRSAVAGRHTVTAFLYVTFPRCTLTGRGAFSPKCWTELARDRNRSNDTAVGQDTLVVRDVGATAIIAPTGTVDSGHVIVPQASVRNFGTGEASFDVRLDIGTWNSTKPVSNLAPNTSWTVSFDPWTAPGHGQLTARCSTRLSGDMIVGNNWKATTVTARTRDVGVFESLAPRGGVDSGVPIPPVCSLYNFGTQIETYVVRMRTASGYNQIETVSVHASHAGRRVTFRTPWTPSKVWRDTVFCRTELTGDLNSTNDTASDTCRVRRIWQVLANPTVSGRWGAVCGVAHDTLYAAGGRHNNETSNACTDSIVKYSLRDSTWLVDTATLHYRRWGAAGAVLNDTVYVAGGFDSGNSAMRSCGRFDPKRHVFDPISDLTAQIGGAAGAVVANWFYVVGGQNGGNHALPSVYCFADTGTQWVTGTSLPVGRRWAAAVGINNNLYVMGGFDANDSVLSDCRVLDVSPGGNWQLLESMPGPRAWHSAVVCHGCIYVLGGVSRISDSADSRVYRYDPAESTWSTVGPMPHARGLLSAAVWQDTIFVAFGSNCVPGNPGTVNRLDKGYYGPFTKQFHATNEPVLSLPPPAGVLHVVPSLVRDLARVQFTVTEAGRVQLALYDVRGVKVRTLLAGRVPTGEQIVPWDGRSDRGQALPNGTYFCRLTLERQPAIERIILLR
jgi:hypothetical protein